MRRTILFAAFAALASLASVTFSSSAFAQRTDGPGSRAYGKLSGVEAALRARNFRQACQLFGEFRAHRSYVNSTNTDHWTSRNLQYAAEYAETIERFCSGPDSAVTVEEALKAARSATDTIGLE